MGRRARQTALGALHRWTQDPLMLIVAVLALLVAIPSGIVAMRTLQPRDTSAAPANAAPSGESPAASASSPASIAAYGSVSPPCGVPESGAAAHCTSPDAALRLSGADCSVDEALQAWGLDPHLDALDLIVTTIGGRCWAAPGAAARSAGATAENLLAATRGEVPSALRLCARAQGKPLVACDQPHEIEWVGQWQNRDSGQQLNDVCAQRAVQYTGMALVGVNPQLIPAAAQSSDKGQPQFRCLIKTDQLTLNGTLRNLRNGALPVG